MSEPSHYDKHACNFIKLYAPAIGILPCCHAISTDYLFHSFPLLFVAMDSDERSNMFVAADEKNSTKWVALLTKQHRNEMSI